MMLEWGVKTVSTNCRSVCEIAQAKMCNKKLGGAVELDRRCRNLPHISHTSQPLVGHIRYRSSKRSNGRNIKVATGISTTPSLATLSVLAMWPRPFVIVAVPLALAAVCAQL
jgi:hypothetical protein